MRKLSLACLIAQAALAAPARAAPSEAGDAPTAVLGLEALEGAPDNIASEITDALRQRIASTKGYQLVQGKDLVEVKLVFSCSDEAPACMSQAGKSMGASRLIFGNVKRVGNDYLITLKLLDSNRGTVESWAAESVPRKRADPSVFRSLTAGWLATLMGKASGGSLQVRANVSGAAVSLDGNRVGMTGADPIAIPDVAAGRHEVAVEKSGYTTAKQEFTLGAGQSLPLSLSLSPVSVDVGNQANEPVVVRKPADGEVPPDGNPRFLPRAGFWIAVVGLVASAGAAFKFGNDVRQINKDLDAYRRFPCAASPMFGCDVQMHPQSADLTLEERGKRDAKINDGNRAQTLQWVFIGLLPPFAIAGGYFLYKGYLESQPQSQSDTGKEGGRMSSSSSAQSLHGLRIFPSATASSGGIIAEFDF